MTKSRKHALIEIDEMFSMGLITESDRDTMLAKYENTTADDPSFSEANEASNPETDIDLSDDAPVIEVAPEKKTAKKAEKQAKTPKTPKTPKEPKKEKKSIVAGALEVAAEKQFRRKMKNGGIVEYIRALSGGKIDVGGGSMSAEDIVSEVPAVKAQDKLLDVLEGAYAKKQMTVYSRLAFEHLRKNKSLKTTEFANTLMDTPSKNGSGYSVGTARSQAQQMHSVFKALCIIGEGDAINPNSKIVERLGGASA